MTQKQQDGDYDRKQQNYNQKGGGRRKQGKKEEKEVTDKTGTQGEKRAGGKNEGSNLKLFPSLYYNPLWEDFIQNRSTESSFF